MSPGLAPRAPEPIVAQATHVHGDLDPVLLAQQRGDLALEYHALFVSQPPELGAQRWRLCESLEATGGHLPDQDLHRLDHVAPTP